MKPKLTLRDLFCLALLVATAPSILLADSGDETLRYYLSRSQLVIVAEILEEPQGHMDEVGVVNYPFEAKVEQVIQGRAKVGDKIALNAIRFEDEAGDESPELKKGNRCIFFLKRTPPKNIPAWETADFWFGVTRYSPWMVKSLVRLASEKPK